MNDRWSPYVDDPSPGAPKGDISGVLAELVIFLAGANLTNDRWNYVRSLIVDTARAYNRQIDILARKPPTAKVVIERLRRVEEAARLLAQELSKLDTISTDWLIGEANPIRGWMNVDLRSVDEFQSDLHVAFDDRTDNLTGEVQIEMPKRLWALAGLARMAKTALRQEHGHSKGGEADMFSKQFGDPKRVLVEAACGLVYLCAGVDGAKALTATKEPSAQATHRRPSVFRLAQELHKFAMGEEAAMVNFERAISTVVPDLRAFFVRDDRRIREKLSSDATLAEIFRFRP